MIERAASVRSPGRRAHDNALAQVAELAQALASSLDLDDALDRVGVRKPVSLTHHALIAPRRAAAEPAPFG